MNKKNYGIVTIYILLLIPVLIWFFMKPIGIRFISAGAILTSLGQVAALLGMTLFSLALILSGRFKFLENFFGGLNRIYVVHHIVGATAFILLLFHPVFLALKFFLVSPKSAALFLMPSDDWVIGFGKIALILLIICIFLTFFAKLLYQNWKFTHKFLGLSFFFASLHALFVQSDISQNQILRFYVLTLALLGIVSFSYRVLLVKLFVRYLEYVTVNVKILTENIFEIELKPKNEKLKHDPGQFVFVSFRGLEISPEFHPFSISSATSDENLKITIKTLGDYTSQLKNLKIGTSVKIEGPFGKVYQQNLNSKKQVWIAGGIGITPFIGLAKSLNNNLLNIDLYYCVNNRKEAVYVDTFSKISQENNKFKMFLICTDTAGLINVKSIQKSTNDLPASDIFLCGPPKMMKELTKQFIEVGVSKNRIHSEEFQFS